MRRARRSGGAGLVVEEESCRGERFRPKMSRHGGMEQERAGAVIQGTQDTLSFAILLACVRAGEAQHRAMFGKESAGIPEEILVDYEETCVRIPMLPHIRSLNLSNSAAIVLYEALRQQQFAQMEKTGHLHRLHWKDEI